LNLNQNQQISFDEMGMAEKIAILLMQLGEDVTATIFSRMNVEAITQVSKYIASNRSVEKNIGGAVLEEFYAIIQRCRVLKTSLIWQKSSRSSSPTLL